MKRNKLFIKRCVTTNTGNAMVLAVTVSVILMILMLTGLVLVRQQTKLVVGSKRKSEALMIAEAGLDTAIWRLERSGEIANNTTINDSNTQGSYSVLITRPQLGQGNDFYYKVESTGTHTASGQKKKVVQDVYYINMSRVIFTYSGANGGGTVTGNVNIWGPFYTSGDLSLGGTSSAYNLTGTAGNPLMIRGNLFINSNSVEIGTVASPMSVFVKGDIKDQNNNQDRTAQVHEVTAGQVPEVNLPEIVRAQFLDSAQANDNAVYTGNLVLNGTTDKLFGQRGDGSYTFNYDASEDKLIVEGTIFIDGDLTISDNVTYSHGSGYTQSTVYVDGQIKIGENNQINVVADTTNSKTYPKDTVLAFVNEDIVGVDDDIYINVASGASKKVQAFFYSSGRMTINKQVEVNGTVIVNNLLLNQVPDLKAPDSSVSENFPYLFPGEDLAFITTAKWREVSPN